MEREHSNVIMTIIDVDVDESPVCIAEQKPIFFLPFATRHLHSTLQYFLRIQKLRDGFLVFFRLNVAALKVVKINKNAIESRRGLCSMLCT